MAIEVDQRGAVALVTIDRQDALNACDLPTLGELRDRLREVAAATGVRAVVLTGAGEKAFAAGADIKYMNTLDVEGATAWGALGHEATRLLETMPKPTIAAVNGFALGGGCELALACDLRYASENARFGQPEISLGLVPGWGGTQRLARVVGMGLAKDLIFTGRTIDAAEAHRIGLVSAVHQLAELLPKTLETAEALAAKSPVTLAALKRLLDRPLGGSHEDNLAAEVEEFGALFASEDAHEGMSAFTDKRPPTFVGR